MIFLWRIWRSGGTGPGPLPEAGGALDQPAWLFDAFSIMEATARQLEAK